MIEIIPAIDIIEGKCVRLSQGDFSQQKIYSENPVEVAKRFEGAGFRRLHVVDLDGAKNGKVTNLRVLDDIAKQTDLVIDFGGGIKTNQDIESVFSAGAAMASIGSIAVKEPDVFFAWVDKYGSSKILLGADVKDEKVAINGWQTATDLEIIPFLRRCFAKGVTQVFCTDISKDGLLQGPANDLYTEIRSHLPSLDLIASGGVHTLEDVFDLEKMGCSGVIIGKAIYENKISLEELVRNFINVG